MKNNVKKLLGYLTSHKADLIIVFFALCIVATSLLAMGVVLKYLIDQALISNQIITVNHSILLISLLIVIFALGSFFRSYSINLITEKIISQIRSDSYKKLLSLEIVTFEELKIADLLTRLGSDLELVGTLITNFLSFFIRNTIMLFGAIILMFFQSPKLSLIVIFSIPILVIPLLRLSKHVRAISKKVLEEKSELSCFIEESFSAIRTLYSFNQQNYLKKRFDKKLSVYIKISKKRLKLRSLFFAFAIAAIAGSITMVIWIGTIDIIENRMTSGQMISFIYYAIIVGMSSGGISELFSEIHSPLSALGRVFELQIEQHKNSQKNIDYKENTSNTLQNHDISFENVSFSYPSRSNILALDNVSFCAKQNQLTAIVGKSGSGKSTIMQLILGFYQNQLGKIKIANNEIDSYNLFDTRKIMAYTPQEADIFSGTIKYNITFSKPNATDLELKKIIHLCGIDKFVNQLPDGLETKIGEKGVRLSGGQKQRIAIARALLYDPKILLLDEATSALDSESEKEILDNIRKIMQGKMVISIAHRISSIQNFDKILVVDSGKIIDSGVHLDLLKNSDIYKKLYKKSAPR